MLLDDAGSAATDVVDSVGNEVLGSVGVAIELDEVEDNDSVVTVGSEELDTDTFVSDSSVVVTAGLVDSSVISDVNRVGAVCSDVSV